MTSDAKIGLLLGLVFIVTIAFLINGLPGLLTKESSNMGVNTDVPAYGGNFGITEAANEAFEKSRNVDPFVIDERESSTDGDKRFDGGKHVAEGGSKGPSDKNPPASTKKFYTVKSGDSLGRIAIKFYGKEVGNKQATVDLIFQTNSNILDSPDDIAIDQKLIMPLIGGDKKQPAKKEKATAKRSLSSGQETLIESGLFEKAKKKVGGAFKDVFASKKKKTTSLSVYVVKNGDSLWDIAAKRLGKGTRYREIIKLNNSILKGANDLAPDMKLRMPQK